MLPFIINMVGWENSLPNSPLSSSGALLGNILLYFALYNIYADTHTPLFNALFALSYKFRPVVDNPYLKLDEDEEDAEQDEARRQNKTEGETIVMEPLEPKTIDVTIN